MRLRAFSNSALLVANESRMEWGCAKGGSRNRGDAMAFHQPVAEFVDCVDDVIACLFAKERRHIRESVEGRGNVSDLDAGNGADLVDDQIPPAAIGLPHPLHIITRTIQGFNSGSLHKGIGTC